MTRIENDLMIFEKPLPQVQSKNIENSQMKVNLAQSSVLEKEKSDEPLKDELRVCKTMRSPPEHKPRTKKGVMVNPGIEKDTFSKMHGMVAVNPVVNSAKVMGLMAQPNVKSGGDDTKKSQSANDGLNQIQVSKGKGEVGKSKMMNLVLPVSQANRNNLRNELTQPSRNESFHVLSAKKDKTGDQMKVKQIDKTDPSLTSNVACTPQNTIISTCQPGMQDKVIKMKGLMQGPPLIDQHPKPITISAVTSNETLKCIEQEELPLQNAKNQKKSLKKTIQTSPAPASSPVVKLPLKLDPFIKGTNKAVEKSNQAFSPMKDDILLLKDDIAFSKNALTKNEKHQILPNDAPPSAKMTTSVINAPIQNYAMALVENPILKIDADAHVDTAKTPKNIAELGPVAPADAVQTKVAEPTVFQAINFNDKDRMTNGHNDRNTMTPKSQEMNTFKISADLQFPENAIPKIHSTAIATFLTNESCANATNLNDRTSENSIVLEDNKSVIQTLESRKTKAIVSHSGELNSNLDQRDMANAMKLNQMQQHGNNKTPSQQNLTTSTMTPAIEIEELPSELTKIPDASIAETTNATIIEYDNFKETNDNDTCSVDYEPHDERIQEFGTPDIYDGDEFWSSSTEEEKWVLLWDEEYNLEYYSKLNTEITSWKPPHSIQLSPEAVLLWDTDYEQYYIYDLYTRSSEWKIDSDTSSFLPLFTNKNVKQTPMSMESHSSHYTADNEVRNPIHTVEKAELEHSSDSSDESEKEFMNADCAANSSGDDNDFMISEDDEFESEHEIEAVIGKHVINGCIEYKVHWAASGNDEDEWFDEESLCSHGYKNLIDAFEASGNHDLNWDKFSKVDATGSSRQGFQV